jgi:cyclophilin family peptidyl-prolyl cis-trans isomerase
MVQFGLHANPTITRVWQSARIPPDKITQSNQKGFITFAMGATPDTRTTQVFINFRNNTNLDSMGFAPFGEVVSGIEVVDKIYTGYGEGSPRGSGCRRRGSPEGNAYLTKSFPRWTSSRRPRSSLGRCPQHIRVARVRGPAVCRTRPHALRDLVDTLEHLEPERARFARFAYVLGRVAHADRHISPEETRAME